MDPMTSPAKDMYEPPMMKLSAIFIAVGPDCRCFTLPLRPNIRRACPIVFVCAVRASFGDLTLPIEKPCTIAMQKVAVPWKARQAAAFGATTEDMLGPQGKKCILAVRGVAV